MDEVSKALPDLLWLTNLDLEAEHAHLRGQALNENAVANFISNLAASPFFVEPSLRIMQQDGKGVFTLRPRLRFTYTPRRGDRDPAKAQS